MIPPWLAKKHGLEDDEDLEGVPPWLRKRYFEDEPDTPQLPPPVPGAVPQEEIDPGQMPGLASAIPETGKDIASAVGGGVSRGAAGVASAYGGVGEAVGELASRAGVPEIEAAAKLAGFAGGQASDALQGMAPETTLSQEGFFAAFQENPGAALLELGAESTVQLGSLVAAGAVGGPLAAGGLGFLMEGGNAYAEKEGAPEDERLRHAGTVAISGALLESLGIQRLLKVVGADDAIAGRKVVNAVVAAAQEAGTESLQEISSIVSTQLNIAAERQDRWGDLVNMENGERIIQSAVAGALAGGGLGSVIGSLQSTPDPVQQPDPEDAPGSLQDPVPVPDAREALLEQTGDDVGGLEIPTELPLSRSVEETDLDNQVVRRGMEEAGEVQLAPQAEGHHPIMDEISPESSEGLKRNMSREPGDKRTVGERAREFASGWAREYKHLPRGDERWVGLRDSLRKRDGYRQYASDWVGDRMSHTLDNLTDQQYELFVTKRVYDDARALVDRKGEDYRLHSGLTPESLQADGPKVDSAVEADPVVQQALERDRQMWREVRDELKAAYQEVGMSTDFLDANGDAYMHHQVVEYALANEASQFRNNRTLKGRSFQKKAKGSDKDISLHYAEVQAQVLSQMRYDAEMARQRKRMEDLYDQSSTYKEQARGTDQTWQELAKEDGKVLWQPEPGSSFFMADTILGRVANQILQQGSGAVNATDLRQTLAVGGRNKEWAVDPEVAAQLNEVKAQDPSFLGGAADSAQDAWRVWTLLSPPRLARYIMRNFGSDASTQIIHNPKLLKHMDRSRKELLNMKKGATPELEAYMARGGSAATATFNELVRSERDVMRRLDKGVARASMEKILKSPATSLRRWFDGARKGATFFEQWTRYASFLSYREQMMNNPDGLPDNWGASRAEEITAKDADGNFVLDLDDRAYWLANELAGSYDMLSEHGKYLRNKVIPFWSFQELNMRRHWRLARNAVQADPAGNVRGLKRFRKVPLKVGAMTTLNAARVLALMNLVDLLAMAWNYGFFPDVEEELPEDVRRRNHFIIGIPGLEDGRTAEGNPRYFDRLSVFSELREWLGLDYFLISDYLKGRKTKREVVDEMLNMSSNKLIQGAIPIPKVLAETVGGQAYFPDVWNPRVVRDRTLHLARSFGLGGTYKALANAANDIGLPVHRQPTRGVERDLQKIFFYVAEAGQSQYFDVRTDVRNFQKKLDPHGQTKGFPGPSSRGQAKYQYRRSVSFGDEKGANYWADEYIRRGGDLEGLGGSTKNLHPLYGLNDQERADFEAQLDDDGLERLSAALDYYQFILGGED